MGNRAELLEQFGNFPARTEARLPIKVLHSVQDFKLGLITRSIYLLGCNTAAALPKGCAKLRSQNAVHVPVEALATTAARNYTTFSLQPVHDRTVSVQLGHCSSQLLVH